MEKEIRRNLKDCTVFVALLSENFRKSYWANQEVGQAVALRKTIFPIKLENGINPYGFIEHLQAMKWDFDDFEDDIQK